ncbi:hypothetical protein OEB99_02820 [Actinotalea sp. M2MS4P-6]|uniref:hypothetical protein n=1 Tax=Actinotalea sp. M2MS4P-6 TaxID=2983762 RepID=UPI0021E4094F|nr:hypothetical protein [Actinotalea sp. M2MS4P-6]MCV2393231.1 hypothetical protein [Actinotalea sp. M2MS4P-6]
MRLYTMPARRDDDVALDVLPPVMGTAEVSVVRVPAGGTLEHPATQHRRIITVVSGAAVVEAAGHPPVELGPGLLLLWERGEVELTRAVTDLVAVVVDCVGMLDLAGRYPEVEVVGPR